MTRRLAVVAAVLTLVLAACTPERTVIEPTVEAREPEPAASSTVMPEPAQSRVFEQSVNWSRCGELECATIQTPVDWAQPDGPTMNLALNRAPATDPEQRRGSLLINPGGPGSSGLEATEAVAGQAGERLTAAYDLVGFDPRGVGESDGVRCGDAEELDAYFLTDLTLETQTQIDEAREQTAAFAARCRELSGAVALQMDTVSAARDMDLIRTLLGEERLNYLGYSYGTQLGATYAQTFPQNVGRMVLDGAYDFLLPQDQLAADQAEGFERAFAAFVDWCLTGSSQCPLEQDPAAATLEVKDLLLQARDAGFPGVGGETVNASLMWNGLAATLYDQVSWPILSTALEEVLDNGTAEIFHRLAGLYLDKNVETGEYESNMFEAFTTVTCLDAGIQEPYTEQSFAVYRSLLESRSPTFGWLFASGLGCDGWPFEASERITALDRAGTGAPILVIGTTRDPATPYAWAESLTDRIGNATLLTYDGDGHTAYGRSNQCIIDAVDGYLVDGEMPAASTVC